MLNYQFWLFALVLTLSPGIANAQAYKCKTASGQTLISDSPCSGGGRTVSVVQAENISFEQRQQAAAAHEKRRAEVQKIDAEYTARNERQHYNSRTTSSANDGTSKYRDAACEAASKPYPGSQGGLTAAQLQTLAACGGVNTPQRDDDYASSNKPQKGATDTNSNGNHPPSQLIDTKSGKVMPSIGGGNFIDPVTGAVMNRVAGGVINTQNGKFIPTTQ